MYSRSERQKDCIIPALFRLLVPVFIGLVLVSSANALAVAAADDVIIENVQEVQSEEISLSESRIWQDLVTISENVIVVTQEKIKTLPVHNLAEILHYIPGFSCDLRGKFGHPITYSLHGSEPQQVRIMIDGIDFNNQISGQAAIADIPVGNIERIEIIKGAVSSRWGSALGGVINVITKDAQGDVVPHGSFSYLLGEHKHRRYTSEVYGGYGDFGYYIGGEYGEAGGSRNYDDTLAKNASTKLSYAIAENVSLKASFGYMGDDQSEGFYPDSGDWLKQNYYARYGKVVCEGDLNSSNHFRYATHLNNQSFRSYNNFGYPRSEFHDKMWGITGEHVLRFRDKDVLSYGFDYSYDQLQSLNIPNSVSMHSEAVYAQYAVTYGYLSGNMGVRYDWHSDFDGQVSPSVGLVCQIPKIPNTRVRATFSRGYNAPALLWLFYSTGAFKSNPDLKPERSWIKECGLESQPFSRLWLKVNVHQADVSDDIGFDASTMMYRNNKKYRYRGLEIESKVRMFNCLYLSAAGSLTDVEDRSTGDTVYANDIARNSVKLGILYNDPKVVTVNLLGNYQRNRATGYIAHENAFICDLKISKNIDVWRSCSVDTFLNVSNIFNSTYFVDNYYPTPRRYVEGGVTIRF